MKKLNNSELALKLFNPDENGFSRWVCKDECVGEFSKLFPNNGNHWYRNNTLKKFIFEKKIESGKIFWRFNGLKENVSYRNIQPEIWNEIRKQPCVITRLTIEAGHKIEVDHKDGRYPLETTDISTQKKEHFQPLLDSLNKQKRSDCLKCRLTNIRYDAKERGFTVSVTSGTLDYDGTCVGCFWFDPKDFVGNLSLK